MNHGGETKNKSSSGFRRAGWVLVLGVLFWLGFQLWQGDLLPKGSNAPPWQLTLVKKTGQTLDLESLRGKVVVLDFWSITCPPCLRQMEILEEIRHKTDENKLAIVGVTVNSREVAEVREFLKEYPVEYPVVIDPDGAVALQYRVSSLPTLYIVDVEGRIADAHTGLWSKTQLLRAIKSETSNSFSGKM